MALKIASTTSIGCSSSIRRPACMLPARQTLPATPSSSRPISWHRAAIRTAFAGNDFVIADDSLMNSDEQREGREGFDDSEAMRKGSTGPEGEHEGETGSGGGRGPGELQEVTFTEQDMAQTPPDLPDAPASKRASETGTPGEFEQAGETKAVPAGGEESAGAGRFDEEATTPVRPYSPRPKDRGHGVPPHKDASNTGPGPTSGSAAGGEGHPTGDEQNPAAAI